MWQKITAWAARINANIIISVDGGMPRIPTKNGKDFVIATRAAVMHDGTAIGGRLLEPDAPEDNYVAELAAALDSMQYAIDKHGHRARVVLIFDATSPVRGALGFGSASQRHKADKCMAKWLDCFVQLRRQCEAIAFLWQTSHVGEPINEWADMQTKAYVPDDILPVPRAACTFASITFPEHRKTARAQLQSSIASWALKSTRTLCYDAESHIKPMPLQDRDAYSAQRYCRDECNT